LETILEVLAARVQATPDAVAFRQRTTDADGWQSLTWREFSQRVEMLARFFLTRCSSPGQRIAIVAKNHASWELVQFAAFRSGAVVVGLDPNYGDALLSTLLVQSRCTVLCVEDAQTLGRLDRGTLSNIRQTVMLSATQASPASGADPICLDDVLKRPQGDVAMPDIDPLAPAIIVFSSGTTGVPKMVRYSHGQIVTAVRAILDHFAALPHGGNLLCWLPLANLFQRIINFCAIERGAVTYMLADPRKVMDVVREVSPEVFVGVPRVYERIHQHLSESLDRMPMGSGSVSRRLLFNTKAVAPTGVSERHEPKTREPRLSIRRIVARAVVQRIFGRNLRYLLSGSAPLPDHVQNLFASAGFPVLEAYGVTECIVPVAMSVPGNAETGAVGPLLAANQVRLAPDGEVLVKGPGVFSGYLTAEDAVEGGPDSEGYLHTGDVGALEGKLLRLSGRKTDFFKLSTGRWVVPAPVEKQLQKIRGVDSAVVIGYGRKMPAAILALSAPLLGYSSQAELEAFLGAQVTAALSELPDHLMIRGVLLLGRPLSPAQGELTTNLKVRRRAIESKFEAAIDELFARMEHAPPSVPGAVIFKAIE
jgi:long-chain acyl-CoA synthetase